MHIIFLAVISYLIGAIPSGYIMTKRIKGIDLRNYGSGNIGATNVARMLGIKMGFLVALFDIFKGFFAVFLAQIFLPVDTNIYAVFLIALMAIIGHNWSIFLRFSGGKGVATTIGVIFKILPLSFFIFIAIWILLTILTHYVSIGSLLGAISLPISSYFISTDPAYIYFMSGLALIIILSHHANIKRLIQGNENKMSFGFNKNKR